MVEHELNRVLHASMVASPQRDAMAYGTLGGGKRLRPILAWHCCEAIGDGQMPGDASLPAGVAVEFVHCFSLVHDDLPALDNDDLRRGKPTLHKHAGEAMAILAGDALLTLAFEHLSSPRVLMPTNVEPVERHSTHVPLEAAANVQLALVRELSHATNCMIQGQVWDTLGGLANKLSDEEKLTQVHSGKTGALIGASCRMGAMIGIADSDEAAIAPITHYAKAIGVLFQAVDDLLDVTQTAEHTGKRTGKDADAGKLTYPGLFGVDGTRAKIKQLREHAHEALRPLGTRARTLEAVAEYLAQRTK